MTYESVIAASGAVNSPLIPRTPGWHGPEEVPEVERNDYRYFQIAVRRKNSGKVFSFPAVYCNTYAVTVEYDPSESQGTSWSMHFLDEDLAGEGELGCTGWWEIKSNNEYDCQFTAALEDGDELVGWCELPQWDDPSNSRGAKELPPLPEPTHVEGEIVGRDGTGWEIRAGDFHGYTEDQMREYGLACILSAPAAQEAAKPVGYVDPSKLRATAPDEHHAIARAVWEYMDRKSSPGITMQIAYEGVLHALAATQDGMECGPEAAKS